MKTKFLNAAAVMLIGMLFMTGCKKVAYEGTYTGTMPCADCSGIHTEITVNKNEYTIKRTYEGKGNDMENVFIEKGTYAWDKNKSILTFDAAETEKYKVRNNTLIALDIDGNEVTGPLADMYVLKKK